MDRNDPSVAKLQDSFIAHIVNPLVLAMNEAGLLPVLPALEQSELLTNLQHNHTKWLEEIAEHESLASPKDDDTASTSQASDSEEIIPSAKTAKKIIEEEEASKPMVNGGFNGHLDSNEDLTTISAIAILENGKCAIHAILENGKEAHV
ncbi:3'5'-cyclic nucleotide phosphodiesterase [Aphelenchoides avenae]|nr:3'5'-cyclic nucleotide phosphodiesterase [Aphelenchus avenae]